MSRYRGCQVCRLSLMVLAVHCLMSVTARPHEQRSRQPAADDGRWPLDPDERISDQWPSDRDGASSHPSEARSEDEFQELRALLSCQEVSQRQLWLRLDSVQFFERAADRVPLPATPPVPIVEHRGLKHRDSERPHSRSTGSAQHRQHSKTNSARQVESTSTVELASKVESASTAELAPHSFGSLRHRHRSRRQAERSKKKLRRAKRAKRKFLKRISRTKDTKKLENMLFHDEKEWLCNFEEKWHTLGDDYFPEYVRTGRCAQTECMFGFYRCQEKKYQLPVLRRDRSTCHPIPTTGGSTRYEEAWIEDHVEVVVGCECSPINF